MLRIHVSRERGVKSNRQLVRAVRRAAKAVIKEEGLKESAALSVLLTDDEGIRAVNRSFRDVDKPTDVLSFPANALQKPLCQAMAEGFAPERERPGGRLYLGDVVLSVPRTAAQAREFGHSLKREAAFLAAHATLHLLGYDHQGEEERVMREKQQKALARLRIKR